jgi:hypothetical protein
MRNKLHKLRIAFSVLCGIVCLLLVALWVRSYFAQDFVKGHAPGAPALGIISDSGSIFLGIYGWDEQNPFSPRWAWFSKTANGAMEGNAFGFQFSSAPGGPRILLPYWIFPFFAAALAAMPWIRRQFSVRTLLIITTFAAVLLGAIGYAIR